MLRQNRVDYEIENKIIRKNKEKKAISGSGKQCLNFSNNNKKNTPKCFPSTYKLKSISFPEMEFEFKNVQIDSIILHTAFCMIKESVFISLMRKWLHFI